METYLGDTDSHGLTPISGEQIPASQNFTNPCKSVFIRVLREKLNPCHDV